MKIENILQRFSCISFLFKPPCYKKQPPEVFYKKSILENFAKFTGKQLYLTLFFNKVAGLGSVASLKKTPRQGCFSMKYDKSLTTPFWLGIPGRLLSNLNKNNTQWDKKFNADISTEAVAHRGSDTCAFLWILQNY